MAKLGDEHVEESLCIRVSLVRDYQRQKSYSTPDHPSTHASPRHWPIVQYMRVYVYYFGSLGSNGQLQDHVQWTSLEAKILHVFIIYMYTCVCNMSGRYVRRFVQRLVYILSLDAQRRWVGKIICICQTPKKKRSTTRSTEHMRR